MMRKYVLLSVVTALISAVGVGLAVNGEQQAGFKVLAMGGTKKIVKVKTDGGYVPAKIGEIYAFGTIVKTASSSTVDLELSPGNTFRLMARSKLAITEDGKNPKLKILKLDKGTVSITLDKFPKDHRLEVETPTAVCGALGTRFKISFEDDDDEKVADAKTGGRENKISCEKGEIYAASRFTIKGITGRKSMDVPKMGAGTEMIAKVHEGLENSYTDVSVTRGSLTIDYGVKKGGSFKLQAEEKKPARFVMAFEKSNDEITSAVAEVKSGDVKYRRKSGFSMKLDDIAADSGPVLVADAKIMAAGPAKEVGQYLAAAKVEAEMHSTLVATGKDPEKSEELKAAAKKATDLRKQLLTKRVNKMLQQIRRGARRPPRIRR
jgi:hypothetical protein